MAGERVELQNVLENAALNEITCCVCFRRFKRGDLDVNDCSREGRPKTFEDAELWRASVPNVKRACFRIRSYLTSCFQAIAFIGKDSNARNLGSLYFESERR